ncbi:MAG TPA: SdrD B-like domain-containing protein [Chloroflexia bacterium]|nr:SdrD B-like domain-containing protein [Chloroflexia bacterium]
MKTNLSLSMRLPAGRRGLFLPAFLLLFCALVIVAAPAYAEGSRDLYPTNGTCQPNSSNGSCRANIEFRSNTSYGPDGSTHILRRTLLEVYAKAGEVIEMGSSAVGVGSGDIIVFNPGRVTNYNQYPLPAVNSGVDGFKCSAQRASNPGITGLGKITSRAQELAGPQAITGGGNPTGYIPCYYDAPVDGIYYIAVYGPSGDPNPDSQGAPVADINLTDTKDFDTTQGSSIAAWDVTVRTDHASTTDLKGRLFTLAMAAFTGGNGRPINSTSYVVTTDGFQYKLDSRGLDPNGFVYYGNQVGYYDSDGATPLYHDAYATSTGNGQLKSLAGGVTFAPPEYPIFFSSPDNQALQALGIPTTPIAPVVSNAGFSGNFTGNTSLYGQGGIFTYTSNVGGVYEIIISRDGVNFDPGNAQNRVLRGVRGAGTINVTWDGKDNSGNFFPVNPAGSPYPVHFSVHAGEYHFPLLDAENSTKGGPSFTLLNPPGGACPLASCSTGFFDDRGYTTLNGTAVGTPPTSTTDTPLCGVNPPASPYHSNAVTGFNTASTTRAFGTDNGGNTNAPCTGSFGDLKGLDVWTYFPSNVASTSANIVSSTPDMTIAKSHVGTFVQGGTGHFTITVSNSNAVPTTAPVQVVDTIPAFLTPTAASGTGWTCSISGSTVTCDRSDVLNGSSSYPVIDVTVSIASNAPALSTIVNTATVSGGGEAPADSRNDSASDAVTVLASNGTITGSVYVDANNNGLKDPAETSGIGGVLITLKDATTGNVIATTTTAADGSYVFAGLPAGSYTLVESQPVGYLDGKDAVGTVNGSSNGTLGNDQLSNIVLAANDSGINYNFGELQPATLSGEVFDDANGNGSKDAGENGLGNVTVTLTGTDDLGNPVSLTTATAADGSYSFGNLRPGSYTVTETQPSGYSTTQDKAGSAGGTASNPTDTISGISLNSGTSATGYTFGEISNVPLSGKVYVDSNNNATLDSGEPPLGGVTITLLDSNGNVVATTQTAPDGSYSFTVPPGNYTITETQPTGYGSSTPNTLTVTVPAGGLPNQNFGETTGSLTGAVYLDVNNNGTLDGGETGISGVSVTLTGTDVNGQPVSLTTTTKPDGTYSFSGLLAGTYTLTETQPVAYADGQDAAGSAGGSAGGPGTDIISNVVLGPAVNATGYTFGELNPSIKGNVFVDANADGTLQNTENGLGGVTITLLDSNGKVVATTQTAADGSYSFTNVPSGNYTLVESQPNGYGSSTPNSLNVTLTASGLTNQNFGETTSSLSGVVFSDPNSNGSQDSGETGIGGVTLTLSGTDANGNPVNQTTTTAADGSYSFSGLLSGTYTVTETQPSGYTTTRDTAGSAGGSANNGADTISTINVGAGTSVTGYTFGEIQNVSLTGVVYVDRNANAALDGGEIGLAGVTIVLKDSNGNVVATTTTAADGSYSFNPPPGNYTIEETQPNGYGSSTPNILNVTVPATGLSNQDFGETTGSFSGVVFQDNNNDGIQQSGETGIGGVTIALTGTDANGNPVNLTTTTAADGSYSFSGLLSGTYTITETQPANYSDGKDVVGSMGGTLSNDQISAISLKAGNSGTGYTFGELTQQAIIGIAKQAGTPVKNSDGSYNIPYTLYLKNYGTVALTNVQVVENLANVFASPATFSLAGGSLSATITTGGSGSGSDSLVINPNFNGTTDTNLLVASSSNLRVAAAGTIQFTVVVKPNNNYGPYTNTAVASASGPGRLTATDASTSGTNPDPNGNGNPSDPGESAATVVKLNAPAPTPVPATPTPTSGAGTPTPAPSPATPTPTPAPGTATPAPVTPADPGATPVAGPAPVPPANTGSSGSNLPGLPNTGRAEVAGEEGWQVALRWLIIGLLLLSGSWLVYRGRKQAS